MELKKQSKKQLIVKYIRTLEIAMGESWMDRFGEDNIFLNISFLLGYWSVTNPELYKYLMEESNDQIIWQYPQNGLTDLIESYYNVYDETDKFNDDNYEMSLMPWASIIVFNPVYMKRFLDCHNDFLSWLKSSEEWYDEVPELNRLIEKIKQ